MQASPITHPISRKKCDTKSQTVILPVNHGYCCLLEKKDTVLEVGKSRVRLHHAVDLSYANGPKCNTWSEVIGSHPTLRTKPALSTEMDRS